MSMLTVFAILHTEMMRTLHWWQSQPHSHPFIKCCPICWWGEALRKKIPPTSFYWWLSDQGESSCTIVVLHPTKPQRQSCMGLTSSHRINTNTALMAIITSLTPFQKCCPSCWWGGALRKTTPLYVLILMTEWLGWAFMYHSSTAANQATKPKLHGFHVIPKT
jgi:hypothetical protein